MGLAQELAELGARFDEISSAHNQADPRLRLGQLQKYSPIDRRFRDVAVPLYLKLRGIGYSHGDLTL